MTAGGVRPLPCMHKNRRGNGESGLGGQFFIDVLDVLGSFPNGDSRPLLIPREIDCLFDFIERFPRRDGFLVLGKTSPATA